MARIAPTVTTPVPPTPATRIAYGRSPISRRIGSGTSGAATALASAAFGRAPSIVTNEGQKPSAQE